MPIEVGLEGVRRVIEPRLTRQEQTLLENAMEM
jgi:malate/lactate dehydrogenase